MKKFARLFSLLLALVMLLTLCGCAKIEGFIKPLYEKIAAKVMAPKAAASLEEQEESQEAEQQEEEEEQAPAEAVPQEQPAYMTAYRDLKSDFIKLIQYRGSSTFGQEGDAGPDSIPFSATLKAALADADDLSYAWINMIIDLSPSISANGYILYDINSDGVPEMFWVNKDYTILAIFTFINGKVQFLDAFWSRYHCYVSDQKQVCTVGSNGADSHSYDIYFLTNDGQWLSIYSFYSDWGTYYETSGGVEIQVSEARYNELLQNFSFNTSALWRSQPILPLQ